MWTIKPDVKFWKHQDAIKEYMSTRRSGIINSGPGTGKTLMMLRYIQDKKFKRVLILATNKGINVWKDEIEARTVDGIKYVVDDNRLTVKEQAQKVKEADSPVVYLLTYNRVWRPELLEALGKHQWDAIIADESHKIKAHNSKTSKAVYKLARRIQYVWGVTGTTLTNNPLDIFGQARFVDDTLFDFDDAPVLLNSFTRFRDYFCHLYMLQPGVYIINGYKNLERYIAELDKFVYRVDSDAVLDLPPEQHIVTRIKLSADLMRKYNAFKKEAIIEFDAGVLTATNVLVKTTRLHQLVGGSVPTDNSRWTNSYWTHSEKLEALLDLVEEIPQHEPVVIFALYSAEIAQMLDKFSDKVWGGVSALSGKYDTLKEWQQGKTRILLVQAQTGAESIDLSRAAYTVFYSFSYSMGDYLQALRRTRRPRKDGTKAQRIVYYHLHAEGTIDEVIYRAITDKRNVAESILKHIQGYDT